ncbi:helix-turn-helix domain-containing protein [Salinarchaeum sp. IM2453]|uniref:helix-turn-helix domain-containing protein n=1 Tax=Salinarchaeum sp. IM2453 TaxID=2862870 RepID=UPI002103C4BE|nr:helix-turn-helix domain-containing protein [Salinarchaeum sp. IM2453]
MVGREKEVVKHLSRGDLDRLQAETDNLKTYKRLTFLKHLYDGETLAEAADKVGISNGAASNWVRRWNQAAPAARSRQRRLVVRGSSPTTCAQAYNPTQLRYTRN